MQRLWNEKRLEILTLGLFFIVVFTALFFLYNSYMNYVISITSQNAIQSLVHQVIMFIAGTVLFLSLSIVYFKRNYFFVEKEESTEGLENLFEEIKYSSDEKKIEQFKRMLQEKNHTEIYALISNMILELQEHKKLTDKANEVKTLFLSNMSHEIRTPITGIVGFTNLLSSTRLDNEQKDFISIIQKSSEDLLGLVNNLLDVSKIENGQFMLVTKSFNLMSEFENFVNTYALDTLEKEINFSVWIDPKLRLFELEGDIEKIKQVLTNLISNAIKFTNEGGDIELSIKQKDLGKNTIAIEFMVQDTGIGIEQEQCDEVLKLFSQVDSSDTRAYKGIGLGLTLADNLVKLLGGYLTLESELEKGTSVSFVLEMKQKYQKNNLESKERSLAVYTPKVLKETKSYQHLMGYLESYDTVSITSFNTFSECKDAEIKAFDTLYIYYDDIDVDALKRMVAQYSLEKQIVLVTKLSKRDQILDIAPIFSHVIYEPITLPKIEKSFEMIEKDKPLISVEKEEYNFDLKALVVEDNHINQKVIVQTLKSLGIDSDIASNGEMALLMFAQNRYDIVFMDIQMPVMNGVVATKYMVEYEEKHHLNHTPIIAVTTNALEGDRDLYLKSGMDEYILKPISMQKFLNAIKQFYAPKDVGWGVREISQDILLYKKRPTEGKILMTMLKKQGYAVELAKSREEFYYRMNQDNYKLFLLDKKSLLKEDDILMQKIDNAKIPTLFLMDKKNVLTQDDFNHHTHVMYEQSDFYDVQEQIDQMLKL